MAGTVKKRKVLTKDQEAKLFEKYRSARTDKERERCESRLLLANFGLVVKECRRYRNCAVPFDDLLQEGAVGLLRAIRKFDPGKGLRLSTSATLWIKRDVGRIVRTFSDVIHVSEHVSEDARLARAALARFKAREGRDPTVSEFEKESGMSAEKAKTAMKAVEHTASIHAPVGDDGAELGDMLADDASPDPSASVQAEWSRRLIRLSLVRLRPEERVAVLAFHGGCGEVTEDEFASMCGEKARRSEAFAKAAARLSDPGAGPAPSVREIAALLEKAVGSVPSDARVRRLCETGMARRADFLRSRGVARAADCLSGNG